MHSNRGRTSTLAPKIGMSHQIFQQYLALVEVCMQIIQEGLAVASIARDVVVEMTPPRDDNAR